MDDKHLMEWNYIENVYGIGGELIKVSSVGLVWGAAEVNKFLAHFRPSARRAACRRLAELRRSAQLASLNTGPARQPPSLNLPLVCRSHTCCFHFFLCCLCEIGCEVLTARVLILCPVISHHQAPRHYTTVLANRATSSSAHPLPHITPSAREFI